MHAVILAAGQGSRLRPHTDSLPKPMLSIAGAPILEHNVRLLVRYGVRDIIINLHYLPDIVEQHFADGQAFGANISYSREHTLLGTGGAVDALRKRLPGDFLIVYGDNLTTLRLDRLLAQHANNDAALTMAVFERADVCASGIVGFTEGGRITRFLEKPKPDEAFSNWVNAGVLTGGARLMQYIPRGVRSDISHDVLPKMLNSGENLWAYRMSAAEKLWWVDSIEDYKRTIADPGITRMLTSH